MKSIEHIPFITTYLDNVMFKLMLLKWVKWKESEDLF